MSCYSIFRCVQYQWYYTFRWWWTAELSGYSSRSPWIQWPAAKGSEREWKIHIVHFSFTRRTWYYSITTGSKGVWEHAQSPMYNLQENGSSSDSPSTYQGMQDRIVRFVLFYGWGMSKLSLLDYFTAVNIGKWCYSVLCSKHFHTITVFLPWESCRKEYADTFEYSICSKAGKVKLFVPSW